MLIGAGATAFMDVCALLRHWLRGTSLPDYGLVGRWCYHVAHGRFHHASIVAAARVRGERVIGWSVHYLVGIAFAFTLLVLWGIEWARRPTVGPALIVGVGSVAAPFLVMQPAMGAGIASRRTPHPAAARLRSVVAHAFFGVGLYAAACVVRLMAL